MSNAKNGLTDETIIRKVLSGDSRAFGLLVERYRSRVLGLAFHLTGDYDAASDLAQETLIAAYFSLDRLRDLTSFSSWISGILRNKHRNLGRNNHPPAFSLDRLMESGFEPPIPDDAPSVSEEDLREVMDCVGELPGKYRETLLLRYDKDLSYKEIAEFLGLPVTTVTTRLAQARKRLVKKAKAKGLL